MMIERWGRGGCFDCLLVLRGRCLLLATLNTRHVSRGAVEATVYFSPSQLEQ